VLCLSSRLRRDLSATRRVLDSESSLGGRGGISLSRGRRRALRRMSSSCAGAKHACSRIARQSASPLRRLAPPSWNSIWAAGSMDWHLTGDRSTGAARVGAPVLGTLGRMNRGGPKGTGKTGVSVVDRRSAIAASRFALAPQGAWLGADAPGCKSFATRLAGRPRRAAPARAGAVRDRNARACARSWCSAAWTRDRFAPRPRRQHWSGARACRSARSPAPRHLPLGQRARLVFARCRGSSHLGVRDATRARASIHRGPRDLASSTGRPRHPRLLLPPRSSSRLELRLPARLTLHVSFQTD
jgi:hypothetical protein